MRRSLLNKRILPKPLRQALVLITLLLLPSAAWGQDITVAGNSPDQSGNITGTGITGTVYYDDNNKTLTLTNATIEGNIEWNIGNDLKLMFSGTNRIINIAANASSNYAIKGSGSNALDLMRNTDASTTTPDALILVSYYISSDTATPVNATNLTDLITGFSHIGAATNSLVNFENYDENNINYKCYTTSDNVFELTVGGRKVHNIPDFVGYKNYILGDGKVSFKPANEAENTPATLTLNNATIDVTGDAIQTSLASLTIDLQGTNSINANGYVFYGIIPEAETGVNRGITITSSSTSPGTLTLYGTLAKFATININESVYGSLTIDWANGSSAVIAKGFTGLMIAETPITSDNIGEDGVISGVSGITQGTVAFAEANEVAGTPATLTLNGATINGQIKKTSGNLTVHIIGNNVIKLGSPKFAFIGSGNLIFTQGEGTECKLRFEDISSTDSITSGFSLNTSSIWTGETHAENYDWMQSSNKTGDKWYYDIIKNNKYDLWLGSGTRYCDANLGLTGEIFDPTKSTLTFRNINGDSYQIYSGLPALTINIGGETKLKAISFGAPNGETIGATSGKLTIMKNETSTAAVNKLTLANDDTDGGVISPMGVKIPSSFTTWGERIHKAVISDEVFYDLWVEGIQVTSGNASKIKYITDSQTSEETPTVFFDAENNILTLNNALIEAAAGTNGIESKLSELTVNIVGENKITSGATTDAAFKGTGTNAIAFTFGDTDDTVKAIMSKYPISGLTPTFQDGYGLTSTGENTHYLEYLECPDFSSASTENGITVTLNKPYKENDTDDFNAKYENAIMYYSIAYANEDDNVAVTKYTEPFSMTKPGIVTAYLTPGEGKGQSEDAIGKYFGYTESSYIVGEYETTEISIYPALDEEDDYFSITYSSEDTNIATFTDGTTYGNGVITGVNVGKTNVSATLSGGYEGYTPLNIPSTNGSECIIKTTVNVGESLNQFFERGNTYGTFCNTSETQKTYKVPEGITAYIVIGVDGNKVSTKETKVLPPNKPVLLERGDKATAFTYIEATEEDGSFPSETNLLIYAKDRVTVPENGKLYVLYNDMFVKATAGSIIDFRCYLDLSVTTNAGTRGFYNIGDGEGTTAIKEVKSGEVKGEKLADGEWFDLQGRRLNAKPNKSGLYILNGRKVVIK